MKPPLVTARLAVTTLAALLALVAVSGLPAAGGPPPDPDYPADNSRPPVSNSPQALARFSQLVIQNGKITPNGQDATLGNVVVQLNRRYQGMASIILAGTADVRVGDITLRLSEQNVNVGELHDVFVALRETSGRAFTLSYNQGTETYTLGLPTPSAADAAPRHVAVFNLVSQLNPAFATIDDELRKARASVEVLSAKFFEQNPAMLAAIAHVDQLRKQQVELTANQAQTTADRMKEIQSIVAETLYDLGIKDTPAFRFHPSSNLLIVTGTEAALDVVSKIVTAMGGTADGGRTLEPGDTSATVPFAWTRGLTADGTWDKATPVAATTTYTVSSGDTLSAIAARVHTSLQALKALNSNLNLDALRAGQKLQVPAAATPTP